MERFFDRKTIDSILQSGSDKDRIGLAMFAENLLPEDLIKLASDEEREVRLWAAYNRNSPTEALEILSKDSDDVIRAKALGNANAESSVWANAVNNYDFSSSGYEEFCNSPHAGTNLEAFKKLWEKKKGKRIYLLASLAKAIENDNSSVDKRIFSFVDEQIMSQPGTVRETYSCYKDISNPKILDQMKNDQNYAVIRAIAMNPNAWVSTHEYLAQKHKAAEVRMSIAEVTKDNDLLNLIYKGTRSQRILDAVKKNKNFVLKE